MGSEQETIVNKEFFKQLTGKISLLNKRILNEELRLGQVEKLEKEVIREAATERGERASLRREITKPSYLTLILKAEHKVTNGTCIVKLPKMPFGKHQDYNEEPRFVDSHFLNKSRIRDPRQAEDLKEISRKFRLEKKQKATQKRNRTGASTNRQSKDYDVYDMQHGELKCERNEVVTKSYVSDKARYRKYIYDVPKTSKPLSSKSGFRDQEASVERLFNGTQKNETNLASFFVSKYSRLFTRESGCSSNRRVPVLDLSVVNL